MRRWHSVVLLGLIVATAALMIGPKGTTSPAHAAPVLQDKVFAVPASWYGPGFHGRVTANCTRYNQYAYTVAVPPEETKRLRFGSRVRVSNPANGRAVTATVTDTGSFKRKYDRGLDVSKRIAADLGFVDKGVTVLQVEVLSVPKRHIMGSAC